MSWLIMKKRLRCFLNLFFFEVEFCCHSDERTGGSSSPSLTNFMEMELTQ